MKITQIVFCSTFLASRIYFREKQEKKKEKETKRIFYIMSKVSDTIKPQ